MSSRGGISDSWLRRWLSSNQSVMRALEYLATAGVLFIPANLPHYEMATEGCYALSQLIAFFNRTILNRTIERCSRLEHTMLLMTRFISHIEVFIEKASAALAGKRGKAKAVFLMESFKSLCRLGILADRRKPSMLIHWGRDSGRETDPDDSRLDIAHYEQWYKTAAFCFRGNSSPTNLSEPCFSPSSSAFAPIVTTASAPTQSTEVFVGKRSGIVLPPLPADISLPHARPVSTPVRISADLSSLTAATLTPPTASATSRPIPFPLRSNSSLLSDMMDITGAASSSVHVSPSRSIALSSSEESPRAQSPSEDSVPEEGQQERRASSDSPPETLPWARGLSPDQCLVLGELLYVLRPAIYAWTLNFIANRHANQASAHGTDGSERAAGGREKRPSGPSEPSDGNFESLFEESFESNDRHSSSSSSSSSQNAEVGGDVELREGLRPGKALEHAIAIAISIVIEVTSIQLTSLGLKLARDRAQADHARLPSSRQHKFDTELSRRRLALLYYLIRSPIFDRSTLPVLQIASRMLQHIPLLSSLPQYALNMLQYLNNTHFYTSNSS